MAFNLCNKTGFYSCDSMRDSCSDTDESYTYVVTVKKRTKVQCAVAGNFLSRDVTNLVLAKGAWLEIYEVASGAITFLKHFKLFGKVSALNRIQHTDADVDELFVVLERRSAGIFKFVGTNANSDFKVLLESRATGIIWKDVEKTKRDGFRVRSFTDPKMKAIGIHNGISMKVVPLPVTKSESQLTVFSVADTLSNVVIQDAVFLSEGESLILLGSFGSMDNVHLKAMEIDLKEGKVVNVLHFEMEPEIDKFANILIPVPSPWNAVIILGTRKLSFHSDSVDLSIPSPSKSSRFTCYTRVFDADRLVYLLGDQVGNLFILSICDDERIQLSGGCSTPALSLQVHCLGSLNLPSAIVYLGNGLVFNASCQDDSQLVAVNFDELKQESPITIVETLTNLCLMTDLLFVDGEGTRRNAVVCSSSSSHLGISVLENVKNMVEFRERAVIEDLTGIKGVWAACIGPTSEWDNILVISFLNETGVFTWTPTGALEVYSDGDLERKQQTLLCLNVAHNKFVQVMEKFVLCFDAETGKSIMKWEPPIDEVITIVDANKSQIVPASGKKLYYLEIQDSSDEPLVLVNSTQMVDEVSCVSVNPLKADEASTKILILGTWGFSFFLLTLPELKVLSKCALPNRTIPRDVLPISISDVLYLFVSLGDGSADCYEVDSQTGNLSLGETVTLGTLPVSFIPLRTEKDTCVFVCSDIPWVIRTHKNKLVFKPVKAKKVSYMCPLHTKSYPNSLVFATWSMCSVVVSKDVEILKHRFRRVVLEETVSKMVFLKSKNCFVGITTPSKPPDSLPLASDRITDSLAVLDKRTFEITHTYRFSTGERGHCLTVANLGDAQEYLIVGTSLVDPKVYENALDDPNFCWPPGKIGRLLVFSFTENQLQLIAETMTKKGVTCALPLHDTILCGVGTWVCVYRRICHQSLLLECCWQTHQPVNCLKTKDYFILVNSGKFLSYNKSSSVLEEVRDSILYDGQVEFLRNGRYLRSDARSLSVWKDGEEKRVTKVGFFRLGEKVEIFRSMKLFTQCIVLRPAIRQYFDSCPDGSSVGIMYGAKSGAIGLCCQVKSHLARCLNDIQCGLVEALLPDKARNVFMNQTSRFIDGDFLKRYSDLDEKLQEEIAKEVTLPTDMGGGKATTKDLLAILEGLELLY